MESRRVIHWTAEAFDAAMAGAAPPTDDDVWITADGERLDTPEKFLRHWHEDFVRRSDHDGAGRVAELLEKYTDVTGD